jgi:hypothetical protein
MTDEHKLHRDINRQAQAKALIENEMLQEAFAYLEKVFIDEWRKCEDASLRDELWRSQANLKNLRGQLSRVLNNGKLAQREIDDLAEKRKRMSVFGL